LAAAAAGGIEEMPKAYGIFTETVMDPVRYEEYMRAAVEPSVKHGVKPLAMSDSPHVLEGQWDAPRVIILEFESLEAAQAWYDSPEYQACIPLRDGAVEVNGVIVEGRDA
jgi:uncharacterized protein (DUF1330 family)